MTDKKEEETKVIPLPTTITYAFHSTVVSCTEVTEKYNWRKKDPKAPPSETNSEYDTRSLGWTLRCTDGSAIGLFPENPGFGPGDIVKHGISLHKKAGQ